MNTNNKKEKYTPEERAQLLKNAMGEELYEKAVSELVPFGGGMSEYYEIYKIPEFRNEECDHKLEMIFFQGKKFKDDFLEQVKNDTWEKGKPIIYLKDSCVVEHWEDGTINKIKKNKTPKLNPYTDFLINKDGKKIKKIHVLYVDGDPKLCDCCDIEKTRVASIQGITNDVWCICKECVEDILTVWD